jgi:hypothetical protein
MIPAMEKRHVKLSGDVEGSFVIEEALADGRFVVAPEWPSKETSIEEIRKRLGTRAMTPEESEEFWREYGPLMQPPDGEG